MKYYSEEDIKNVDISSQELLELANEVIVNKNNTLLPPKVSIKFDESKFYNTMPCLMPSINTFGIKCINRNPNNIPSLNGEIFLYDMESAVLKAVMDAKRITTLRTAAVAVHSVYLFAKKNYKTIAFIGLGEVGKATLKVLIDTTDRPLNIRLFNYNGQAEELVELYKNNTNISIELYDDYELMACDSDVIISAITYAHKDFAPAKIYKEGVLLVPVHTLGFQECDSVFDKIFGDDFGHICGFKYFDKFKSFNEVTDVLLNKCSGRENDKERIIAYNVGISLHDIALAELFLRKLKHD